uniref:Beta-1,4-N-acetylgalactosaminyltransferase n=1 Tax=Oncorhynchus kisutch TaxID=8019 RepID=A0A8C7M8W6_ONCKI
FSFKGQANLHVFEDWCGSSVAQLRKNLHFPLYPHTRTTVKKLAVAPKWKNYGLRIFGFIHPYRDGDFQFSVSSDDNSEFWVSPDESPLNARLLVYVGQLGTEWTAPGEFSKFRSQSSKSVHLISSRRYYFEILHKQDDKGSDHVEVGWRPFLPGLKYEVIDSAYISLYTDESSLKMNSVDHIPQTLASHSRPSVEEQSQEHSHFSSQHGADMLKPDPRDTFYTMHISLYQENKCFYRESPIYLENINWQRTFSVNPMDFELLRSDWNDLRCNVSGNLQLAESEVVDVLAQYMEKLNERNGGIYTLLRIINVEKRRDSARGNRYLVELELMERGRNVVRLSEYIYLLLHRGRLGGDSLENTEFIPASAPPGATPWGTAYANPLLCQPVMLQWRKDVMVHFVVPVKNQARWVQQFITDMEELHRQTKDDNFSIIIVDFESTDMDVEQALRESTVPRYEYLRREGNFERSAGLQIGVDTIEDNHSIAFLCDLHIHFPHNILESIRKHCVEGRLAFAPIVMRLGCGSSPLEPDGYWEVNGFGLFGIYKSDFDKIGGMNTEEFKDRWGGEDWELLDRVLQNGLEVERLRLRNFFHYYHSKRGMWNAQNKKNPKGGG